MIWEFIGYSVYFGVEEATTEADLLNPPTEGNLLSGDIKVIYQEEVYPRQTGGDLFDPNPTQQPASRDLLPMPFALRWGEAQLPHTEKSRFWLAFGEFDPTVENRHESFIIEWGDGTKNEVAVDCYITYQGNGNAHPTVHRKIWLDGQEITSPDWQIILTR